MHRAMPWASVNTTPAGVRAMWYPENGRSTAGSSRLESSVIKISAVTYANERAINEDAPLGGSHADAPGFRPWIGSTRSVAVADSGPYYCRACADRARAKTAHEARG